MKMESIVSSETSAIRTQTPGNYPKRNKLHLEHGESLKTRIYLTKPASSPSLSRFVTGADGGEVCSHFRKTKEAHTRGTLGQPIAYVGGANKKSPAH